MIFTNSPQQWLAAATLTNYVTYSCWTLLNKWQFTTLGTDCPVFATALQMLIAGGIACAVSLAAYGHVISQRRGSSNNSTNNMRKFENVVSPDDSAAAAAAAANNNDEQNSVLKQILSLGIARAIDIGCGNAALSLVSVALQQILKSLLPLFVCLLSLFLLHKNSSALVWLSLVPIVAGSFMSAIQSSSASTAAASGVSSFGIALALISTFGRSLKAVLNSKLVTGSASALPLRPLEVLSLEAPTSGAILLCVSLCGHLFFFPAKGGKDGAAAVGSDTSELGLCGTGNSSTFIWTNLAAGVLMFFNQLSYISVIKFSSALTCQVLMNVKMLVLICVSIALFHTHVSSLNVAGMCLAAVGCFAYAVASSREKDVKKRRESAALGHDDDNDGASSMTTTTFISAPPSRFQVV